VHKIIFIGLFLLVIGNTVVCAQTEPAALVVKDSLKSNDIDPLTPAKQLLLCCFTWFGSSLQQKYWKIPLVYGALGTSIFIYIDNNKNTINTETLTK
jgi:hypothetical protein